METVFLLAGIGIIILVFGIFNYLIGKVGTLRSQISISELESLRRIKVLLAEAAYISGDGEFEAVVEMLESILGRFYPSSSVMQPYQTWMIIARRHYSNMRVDITRDEDLECSEEVCNILRQILAMCGELQCCELLPIRGHLWLMCWIGLITRMEK